MTRRFTIRHTGWDGHPKPLEELPATLAGMQPGVRSRCTVVEWHAVSETPADEWLDRMRRAELATIPPGVDEEVTKVEVIR